MLTLIKTVTYIFIKYLGNYTNNFKKNIEKAYSSTPKFINDIAYLIIPGDVPYAYKWSNNRISRLTIVYNQLPIIIIKLSDNPLKILQPNT